MSGSTGDKGDSSNVPMKNENQQDANSRPAKTCKNNERGPRNSQSSDYSDRSRKFGGDRGSSRGWRGNGRRYGGGRGGYDRRRGNFNNRRHNNGWRDRRSENYQEPVYSDTNLYVANLPEEWDDKKLASVFVEFGSIESAAIMHTNRDDRQRIAFVNFNEAESAAKTISELHGKQYEGTPDADRGLIVKKAYLKRALPAHQNGRNDRRDSRRFDRNSSHGSMQGTGHFQNNQGHSNNTSNGMNHNKNIHKIQPPTSRRPPSGPPMSQVSQPPPSQPSFQPNSMDSRKPLPSHNSDTDQLTQQMGGNWGPNSAPERHQRNPPPGHGSFQGMPPQQPQQPQQVHRHSGHSNQQPQQQQHQQQQYMMHVVPQMPQMAQNYPYMLDAQGNPMQMQVMDQNGNMVPVMFPSQQMQSQHMQVVNVPTANGEWVQQMVHVPQPPQVQHMQPQMQMQHVDAQQGNPVQTQMAHEQMHQPGMMYEMQHDPNMNPYAMQQMQHAQAQYNAEMQRANSSSQPPPGFQNGHMQHEQMRQLPPGHQYVSENNGHQFASPRMNFGYPTQSQVYSSAVNLPMHAAESSQADNSSSNHLE